MLLKNFWVIATIALLSFTPQGGKKERATFTVYGVCGMCETRIENAINEMDGIAWADWEEATLELTVKYDPEKVNLEEIKQKAAAVGHDTKEFRASKEVYENLPPCCKYIRPENN